MSATGLVLWGLFLFPTSTHSGHATSRPGASAAAVVVKPITPEPASSGPAAAGPAPAPKSLVVNGPVEDTQYGPVQVQVVLRSGQLISAKAVVFPQETNQDLQINDFAIPVLEREAVRAQSANVDAVSGATYTSDGYTRSLQAGLDLAHRS